MNKNLKYKKEKIKFNNTTKQRCLILILLQKKILKNIIQIGHKILTI